MATGSGIPQSAAIATSDITPSYSVPHDNAIAEALGQAGSAVQGVINGQIKRHYEKVGAQQGAEAASAQATASASSAAAAARPESDAAAEQATQDQATAHAAARYASRPVITDVGQAREQAFQGAYLATIKTDIDEHLSQTLRDHPLDPAGYKTDAEQVAAGYAKGAPPQFAVSVQSYAREKATAAYDALSNARAQHDQVRSVNDVHARQQTLSDDLASLAAAGQDGTPEFAAKRAEWAANNEQMVANPLFEYGPNKAAEAEGKLQETLQGAVLTHHATLAYNESGGGEAGKEAALALLKREALDDGGALADVPPDKRLKLYGVAAANVRDLDKADAEQRTIDAEAARQRRADQRDYAGSLALGLVDGTETEASIRQAEAAGKIEPGAAAHLILGSRAQARAAASADRAASAAERSANYMAMKELQENGQLTPDYVARNGGSLTPVQRLALRGSLDRHARPIIENITGLASAAFHDAGVEGAASKLAIENLHADASTFALNNPNATVGQQTAFASDWVKKHKGIVTPGTMTPPSTAVMSKGQYAANYRAKFHGQNVNQGDIDAGFRRYQSTHPTAK